MSAQPGLKSRECALDGGARSGVGRHDGEPCPVCGGPAARHREVVRAGRIAVCECCGSWYRVPRPSPEEVARIYDREYYDSWGLHKDESIARLSKRATFTPLLRRLERCVAHPRGGRPIRILDVGAATGVLLELAAERAWEPWAVELNPFAARLLRERFGPERVFEGELTMCTFPRHSFDVVTMTDLIEHVLDVPGTLRAAAELLTAGGLLALTTPRVDSLTRVLMGRHWLHFKLEHVQYFSTRGLRQALEQSGFAEVRTSGARKHLSLDYLHQQLRTYPHWALTPIVGLFHALAPRFLRSQPMGYRCGEMLVIARRANAAGRYRVSV